jgi:hypothetical protein
MDKAESPGVFEWAGGVGSNGQMVLPVYAGRTDFTSLLAAATSRRCDPIPQEVGNLANSPDFSRIGWQSPIEVAENGSKCYSWRVKSRPQSRAFPKGD